MVAINPPEILRHAVNTLRTHYNYYLAKLFHGWPTPLGRSSSLVHLNTGKPVPKLAPLPLKKTQAQVAPNERILNRRKQGRVERKRYNDLAQGNSTIFMPGGFRKKTSKRKARSQDTDHDFQDNHKPADLNPDSGDDAFVKKQLERLTFEQFKREILFKAEVISERLKEGVVERKARLEEGTREAERLWKMQELERREEKERTDRWKDQRLAQLKREKRAAESELAREKVERKHSKLQGVFKEQQRRRRGEDHWKQLRERDARLAAEREDNLLRKNVMLRANLQAVDNAFRRACNEREYTRQEREGERAVRIRAEESLRRWKESMKEYFPSGQQEQHPDRQREWPQQQPPLDAQFELYEKKWEALLSGIDIDGTRIRLISFSQIPWPVVNMTVTDPSQIRPEQIQQFLMHPLREKPDASGRRRDRNSRARDELKRWHSDRFSQIVLSKVQEEDKQAASEVAGMIARILTDMSS